MASYVLHRRTDVEYVEINVTPGELKVIVDAVGPTPGTYVDGRFTGDLWSVLHTALRQCGLTYEPRA